jgi:hypothetical protein
MKRAEYSTCAPARLGPGMDTRDLEGTRDAHRAFLRPKGKDDAVCAVRSETPAAEDGRWHHHVLGAEPELSTQIGRRLGSVPPVKGVHTPMVVGRCSSARAESPQRSMHRYVNMR